MSNRHISKKLQERFGDPIGSYAGDAPVGVRSVEEQEGPCMDCGMLAVGGACGCASDELTCPSCGMMPVDGQCGCDEMHEAVELCEECGMMEVEGSCGCTHTQVDENSSKKKGKMGGHLTGSGTCECTCEDCVKYVHDENECACGTDDWQKTEAAPKGYEKIVKGLKKEPSVENPWAVAWSMRKKGIRPKQ